MLFIIIYTTLLAQNRSVRTLFATAQQPRSRDISSIKKSCLKTNWLINKKVYLLTYKVINSTYLQNHFLNQGDVKDQIQLRNNGDLRIPLYATTHSQLFVRYRTINTWNGLSCDLRSSSSLCTFNNKLRQLSLFLT